jgi:hypothetical protein
MPPLHLSTFRIDVTPPIGHPLCAGWVQPAVGVSDPLFALGVVLVSEDAPIVLCAIDWCEISNGEHALWREALAEAADTTPDRVAVQSVHQHDAPWPDREAQGLLDPFGNLPPLMDVAWCQSAMERVAAVVRASLGAMQPVTHLTLGEARVEQVASNRRVPRPDGKVVTRYTKCDDPKLRAEPEGLIDPMLKTVCFWNGETKLAALHYYAVHPCSYYGDGWVNSDFVGHARERCTAEDGVPHIYFTGGAGNIGAGKYNDGAPENRVILAERIYKAMVEWEQERLASCVSRLEWRTERVALPPDTRYANAELQAVLADSTQRDVSRYKAALRLTYNQRFASGATIPFTSLFLNDNLCFLHLPGEAFIEYQLFAQGLRPDCFVCVASYGDCGTGYIPLAKSYEEGGYEPTDAFVSPESEPLMWEAIGALLAK